MTGILGSHRRGVQRYFIPEPGIYVGLRRLVTDLRADLERHSETPQEVAEPGTDEVLAS